MNISMSFAALVASALIGCLSGTAWADEATTNGSIAPTEQAPAAASSNTPAQHWQQPPHWRMPQQVFRPYPPQYPPGGQYRAYPAAPVTAATSPLSTELTKAQEQLAGKSSELDEAHSTIEQLRMNLQESLDSETRMSDKLTYSTREQQALRMRVIELTQALEQQNQQLIAERDQLHSKLASLDMQLAELQSRLQAATQVLIQARSGTGMAADAPDSARVQIEALRDALGKLEAELEKQESSPEDDPQTPTE